MAFIDSTAVTTTGTSINASKPALLQPGHFLLCRLSTDIGLNGPAPNITPPAGWTLVTGSNQGNNSGAPDGFTSWVYWKVASSGEPSTWNFAQDGGSTQMIAIVGCWSGRKPNPTFNSTNANGTVNATGNATPVTVSYSGLTVKTNDDIVVFATGDITVGTDTWAFSPPASYTERQDTQVSFDVGTMATLDGALVGPTGTLSLTLTRSAGTGTSGWGIFVIALSQADPAPIFPTQISNGPGKIPALKTPWTVNSPTNVILTENISIDKWYEQYDNPTRNVFPAAALAASLFFVPVISQTETITIDKWFQPIQQPVRRLPQTITGGESRFFDVPRTVLPSDWSPVYQDWLKQKTRNVHTGEFRFEVPRTILLSDWFAEIRQPYFSKFRLIPFGEYRYEVPRTILVSDWFREISQPYFSKRRDVPSGEYRYELPRTILITDWFQPISLPVLRKPTQLLGGESRFELPRTILLSDWYREIAQPYFTKQRQQPSGESRTDIVAPTEGITLDKWFQPTSQPYIVKYRNVHTGEFRFELPRTILLSDWFQDIKQPYFGKFRLIPFGEYRFETPRTVLISDWYQPISLPVSKQRQRILSGEIRTDIVSAIETITIDKWYQPIIHIYANRYRHVHSGEFRFELPRTILISDWLQPTTQPGKQKQSIISWQVINVVSPIETVTVDKWFQPISQPVVNKWRMFIGGESRTEIRTVLITDWWQPTPYIVVKKYRLVLFGEYGLNTPIAETVRFEINLRSIITTVISKDSLIFDSILLNSAISDHVVLESLITTFTLYLDSGITTTIELESIID